MPRINTENKYYIQLNELIDEIIPEKWTELAVYVEFPKISPVFAVYFRINENERFSEIKGIPEKYSVPKETFDERYKKLGSFFFDLRRVYEKEYKGRDCGTISLFVLNGEIMSEYCSPLNEKYSYEKRLAIWKYKEIGVIETPEDATALQQHFGSVNRSVAQGIKRIPQEDVSVFDEFNEMGEIVGDKLSEPGRLGGLFRAFATLMRLLK